MSLLCHGCSHRQFLPQSFVVVVFSLRVNLNSTPSFAVINSLNSLSFLDCEWECINKRQSRVSSRSICHEVNLF